MSKENDNNTEKVISNVSIEEILAGLKNANEKVISNVTMEEILTNLKDFFTPKTKQFNTGAGSKRLQVGIREQFVSCGFEPKIIKLYYIAPVHTGDTSAWHADHENCLIVWWEDGEIIYDAYGTGEDRIGWYSIETTSDGFYFQSSAALEFYLRWEAYA